MARKKRQLTVNVVLDTNSLFTEAAHALLNLETAELIGESNTNSDINTVWHLPEVVRGERKYQMMVRAERLLPQLEKLEKLLGHKLGITRETLLERVEAAILNQMRELGIQGLPLDSTKVDWARLIDLAVNRLPPFDGGEKEKGFRDAVILEAFCQLVETAPKTPSICRTFLITNDELLKAAAEARVQSCQNVRVLGSLEEFRTIINALKSELDEAVLRDVLPKARKLFWNSDDPSCLWHKAVKSELFEENARIIGSKPQGALTVKTSGIELPSTAFIKKDGQKIYFETKVQVDVEAITYKAVPALTSGAITLGDSVGSGALTLGSVQGQGGGALPTIKAPNYLANALGLQPPSVEEMRQTGAHSFAARWHATLTTAGKLTNAQLDSFQHLESAWAD